jgi:nucleoside 2-deoxyribosyltransferase
MKLYFAGPLFTTAERDFNAAVVAKLRAFGHEVFLPQEQEQKAAEAHKIFAADVGGIEWCEVLVACMDGADPDSGTCWECGSVYGRKPVILFRTDIRDEAPPFGPYNLMLWLAASRVLDCKWLSAAEVAERIHDALAIWRTP